MKCETCDSEDNVEVVLDGSGMYHQLCAKHREGAPPPPEPPKASADAPAPAPASPAPSAFESRIVALEDLVHAENAALAKRVDELEAAASKPVPPPPVVPTAPTEPAPPPA